LEEAYAINDSGQIAALGIKSGGNYRALRLDPIPDGIGLTGPDPGYINQTNTLTVRGATPGARVFFTYSFQEGMSLIPGCPGLVLDLANPKLLRSVVADENGHAVVTGTAPAVLYWRTLYFQVIEASSCRTSNVTSHFFE